MNDLSSDPANASESVLADSGNVVEEQTRSHATHSARSLAYDIRGKLLILNR